MDKNGIEFRDLNDNIISNPKDKIHQINKNVEQVFEKIDYKAYDPLSGISVTELWGRRSTQEDRVCFGLLPEFTDFHDKEIRFILENTPRILQNIINEHNLGLNQGSTLCSVITKGKNVYVSNIGDSVALVCEISKTGEVTLKQLNTLHHPKTGRLYSNLGSSLAVSHAIGDKTFEPYGLSHQADFYTYLATIPEGGKTFAVNACDGLMDPLWNMSKNEVEKFIASIYQERSNLDAPTLTVNLAQEAYKRGSSDNISVMAVALTNKDKAPKYMALFDGHGGDEVAEALCNLYEPVLKRLIDIIMASR